MGILTLQGGDKKSVRQWKCVILGVNVVIHFNTSLYKKCKEDCLVLQAKKPVISMWLYFALFYKNIMKSKF